MQTTYRVHHQFAVKGQRHGVDFRSIPLQLPWLPQITTVTQAAGAAADALVITVVDDETQQSYSVSVSGSANEATLLANALAAIRASELNKLFSVSGSGSDGNPYSIVYTARHANRSYTISHSGGNGGAFTVTATQAAGGSGLEFGTVVAYGGAGEFRALQASDTLANIAGVLCRTDANHFHSLESDTPSAVDRCVRGKHYPIDERVWFWAQVEEAVTVGGPLFVRKAQTSSAGTVGALRASAAGGQQVWTVTPTPSENQFLLLVEWTPAGGEKQSVPLDAGEPDGSTTDTEICNGWRTAFAAAQADGLLAGWTAGGTTTFTLTGPAGQSARVSSVGEGVAATAETTPADEDAIYIGSIARVEKAASAGQLALVRMEVR